MSRMIRRLTPLTLSLLVSELEKQHKQDMDAIYTKKLLRIPEKTLDALTDMAKIRKASGEVGATAQSLILEYIEKGLNAETDALYQSAKDVLSEKTTHK